MKNFLQMKSTCVIVSSLLAVTCGFRFFQKAIPNGDRVVNPCDGTTWDGVGHISKEGGGDRNVFGKAFKEAGKSWTTELCRADSDGDGKSNGEELGDPQCTWKPGLKATSMLNITHPGICDPLDGAQCQGKNFKCSKKWSCPAINEPDVVPLKITMSKEKVPAKETTYLCYNKRLPSDKLYDIVASKSVINNSNVMHHMTMYGCEGELDREMDGLVDNCELKSSSCHKMLHIWSLGMEDFCQVANRAVRFGKELTTWVSIQYHWNNPQIVANYTDSSGVEIFYTPKLKQYAVDMFQTGDGAIFIPPNSKEFKVKGLCSRECSLQSFDRPVNITSILLHMHKTGRRMWAKHYRNGKMLRVLAEDKTYRYNRPVIHRFDENPIEFQPGDELQVECTFNTEGHKDWVINGPGTKDEMCLTLISYYPANLFKVENCYSVKQRCGKTIDQFAPGCDFNQLMITILDSKNAIAENCDITNGKICSKRCSNIIGGIRHQHGNCFDNQPIEVSRFMWAQVISIDLAPPDKKHFANAFKACDLYISDSAREKGYFLPAM